LLSKPALGFLVQESFHPLFGGQVLGAANWHFQETQNLFPAWWIPLVVGIAIFESFSIAKGWESPADTKAAGRAIASIKEGYTPGDLDFDPLGLSPPRGTKAFADAQTKELQNGRLAMLAIAGMVAQELVDGKGILRHIYEARLFTAY
jgi:light-harvesting complex I chlorophyll a/b binding protein 1